MKKYLVIGNPIEHSLSPKLHNYWIKENNIKAVYEKKQLNESDIEGVVNDVKKSKIDGINVTTPFKKIVIPRATTKFLLFGLFVLKSLSFLASQ